YTTCSVFGDKTKSNALTGALLKKDKCYASGVVYQKEGTGDSAVISVAADKSDSEIEPKTDGKDAAMPYDKVLFKSYQGRYGYQSVAQLDTALAAGQPDFMTMHYGDWSAPAVKAELEVFNEEMLYARIKIPVVKDSLDTPLDIKLTVSVANAADTDVTKKKVFTVRTSLDKNPNTDAVFDSKIDPYKLGNVHRYDDGNFVYYDVVLDDITEKDTRFATLFKYLDDSAATKTETDPKIFYPGVDITEIKAEVGTTVLSTKDDDFKDQENRAKDKRIWNSIYANGSLAGSSADTALIKNFRHLENLDKRISARDTGEGEKAYKKLGIEKATQQTDLIWRKKNPYLDESGDTEDGFCEKLLAIKKNWVKKGENSRDDPAPAMETAESDAIKNNLFMVYADTIRNPGEESKTGLQPYSVPTKKNEDSYMPVNWEITKEAGFAYEGQNHSIKNLYVRSDAKDHIGAFRTAGDFGIEGNLLGKAEKNPDIYKVDAGIFGFVNTKGAKGQNFEVKNLTVKNPEVTDASSCGGVIGRVNIIESLNMGNGKSKALNAGTVSLSRVYVEGNSIHIAGVMLHPEGTEEIYARGFGGGLIGGTGEATINIDHCHVYGRYAFIHSDALDKYGGTLGKSHTTLGGGCAGGLVASMQWCKIGFSDSFVTAFIYGEYGDCNGGLIGRLAGSISEGGSNSYIRNCYVGGRTKNGVFQQGAFERDKHPDVASCVVGYNATGGLIGYLTTESAGGGIDIDSCFSLASVCSTDEE
ncbi:MAG: hypothetical protein IJV04_04765, partial [Lachnospiraceae bacterium]|nr:hypothetical protein [Lachnospiraceae bacterium]